MQQNRPDALIPERCLTQKDLSQFLDVGERRIRTLVSEELFPDPDTKYGYDLVLCIKLYYERKLKLDRENKSFSGLSEKDLDLLAKKTKIELQQEEIKSKRLKREILEGKYFPAEMVLDTLSKASVAIRTTLDSVLPRIKMIQHDISTEALDEIDKIITSLLNEIVNIEPDLSKYRKRVFDDLEDGTQSLLQDDSDDGRGMG